MATKKWSQKLGRTDPRLSTPITAVDVGGTKLDFYLHDQGVLWFVDNTGAEFWTGVSDLVRIGMFVLAAIGRLSGEGEELYLQTFDGKAALTLENHFTDVHVALDHPDHPRLEGFVDIEEMARAMASGTQMLMPSYSLLELGIDDIKRISLRSRHLTVLRELNLNNG